MMAPPGCPPGSMMMSCVVPPGFGPGMMIQVNTPAGLMNVPIPNGATPGYKFDFLVPAPPPRVAPPPPPPPGEQIIKGDFDGDGVEDTMIIHGGDARIIHGAPPIHSPVDIGEEEHDGKPMMGQPVVKPVLFYGQKIKMRHVETGCRLHSHPHNYPEGSNQQQVTCFEGSDDNDWWLIKAEHDGEAKSGTVNDGAIIRLEHCETNRNLHSHEISSAVTGQGEVSCYGEDGEGDSNDNWRVLYRQGPDNAFRLQHVNTADSGHFLHSHDLKYPDWGFDQQEVTNYAGRDSNDLWVVEARERGPAQSVVLFYGMAFKLQHVATGCRLHSHPHNYPEGSHQQQVTCFEGSDDNDWWVVMNEHGGEDKDADTPVPDGAIITLKHMTTGHNLHSHEISSAVTGQGEVSCYGHGDANDNWRVDYDEGPNDAFRLQHVNTAGGGDGHYLHSHGLKYPDWGFDQQEVTNYAGKDDNDLWVVCEKKAAEFEFKGKFVAGYGKFVAGFECGKYRIKTAGHGPGEQPAGWGLAAWQEHGGKRNDSSSRVAVHEGDHWPCDWEIKPGTQPGTYRIETCGHEEGGQPAGWGLAAWNNIEKRNDSSSWVYVHEGDEWPCDWEIKPGTEPGTYRIYCCNHDAGGQPAGWGLAAWNAHGAERNGSSSWIAVHDGDHWPCDWFLERVG